MQLHHYGTLSEFLLRRVQFAHFIYECTKVNIHIKSNHFYDSLIYSLLGTAVCYNYWTMRG